MRVTQLVWMTAFATAVAVVVFALPQPEPLVAEPAEAAEAALAAVLPEDARLADLKNEAVVDVESRRDFTQQMVDMIFSFNELGFQEFETQRYLTGILENNGFTVELGVAGIPSAWWASWGSGAPVIALGTDVDGIPQASQKPGVAYRDPLIKGAPGHGEGHNAGQALMVTAALAVKKIMERDGLPGTLKIWPGIAEEQLGAKAHYVRAGLFDDVDVVLFSHVSSGMSVSWGESDGNGLVSVEYLFEGESAHGAGSPWYGRSALDAVELMNVGWNYRREHLRIQQRSHYVITDGGDQPNVVPPTAAVWYFFRETDYPSIMRMWTIGNQISEGAAMMTDTTVDSRVLGAAWPIHLNKPLAEAVHTNILEVDLPQWSDADQRMARAVQKMLGAEERGLAMEVAEELRGREDIPDPERRGGASDDIGDISWVVPTVSLRFPSNILGRPRTQLEQGDCHGHSDCPQGRHRRCQGLRPNAARYPADPGAGREGERLLRARSAERDGIHLVPPPAGRAGSLAEPGDHGAVQTRARAVLLRPGDVRHVSRSARHRLSDDARMNRSGLSG